MITDLIKSYTLKRVIDEIALISVEFKTKTYKLLFKNFVNKFNTLSLEEKEEILVEVFKQQSISIDKATSNLYDYIIIPGLARLIYCRVKHEIIKEYDKSENGEVDKKIIDNIICNYLQEKEKLKEEHIINLNNITNGKYKK